jgi:hypothetical protein
VKTIKAAWEKRAKQPGCDAVTRAQVKLWKARLTALTPKKPKLQQKQRGSASLQSQRPSKRRQTDTEIGHVGLSNVHVCAVDGVGEEAIVSDAKTAEFPYVNDVAAGAAWAAMGPGRRIVGVDPNKAALMQCCEVSAWVADAGLCGKKSDTTIWFRHTQNERRFDTKARFLRQRRDEVFAAVKAGCGLDVKAVEADLRNVNSRSADVAGLEAYIAAQHAANTMLRMVYEDPVFRRLRWQGFRAKQRADTNLVRRFKSCFGGPDTTVICWGDWSEHGREGSTHMRFHEPTRGVGLRRLFRRHGYKVWLVDEYLTSKRCHGCQAGECATFRRVRNPRPHKMLSRPWVVRWGLTRCGSCHRLWDRDVNSALNILWVAVRLLVHGQARPGCLSRSAGSDKDMGGSVGDAKP